MPRKDPVPAVIAIVSRNGYLFDFLSEVRWRVQLISGRYLNDLLSSFRALLTMPLSC